MIFQKLKNGCEVVLRSNSHSKLAAVQVWVHAGSIHESPEEYGMAHLLEHMLFKGTKKRAVGQISREVEACGGDINAYTTFDRTVYYLTLDINDLDTGLDILSDAVFDSLLDAEELEREKEVVIEEIRRGLDSPGNQVGRKLFQASYPDHPVGRPIIGYEEGVRSFTRQNLWDFYKRWYQPENMTVVVVGDFDEEKCFAKVENYFAKQPSNFVPVDLSLPKVFPKHGVVDIIKADFKQPRLQIAFAAPDLNKRDSIYLDLAAFVLGAGDLSRLNLEVRDEAKLVTAIGSSLYSPNFEGMFSISAFPFEDRYEEAVKAIGRVLYEFQEKRPITDEELQRAKAHLKMQRILEEETVEGIARNLGFSLTTDQGLYFDDFYHQAIDQATCADVRNAMARHLTLDHFVIVGMLPLESQVENSQVEAAFREACKLQRPVVPIFKKASKSERQEGQITSIELHPGLTLVYKEKPDSSLMSLSMATSGGTRGETAENAGLYNAIASLSTKSSRKHPYPAFTTRFENLGAHLDCFSGKDSYGFSLQGLVEHQGTLLESLAEAIFEPDFTRMHWELTKQQIEQAIESENDQPSRVAIRELKKLIYGDHPYQLPTYGTLESIAHFSEVSLLKEYHRLRDTTPWTIAVVSPEPFETFRKNLESHLGAWHPGREMLGFAASEATRDWRPKAQELRLPKDREQTHIVIGYKGITWSDPDRESLDLLSSILGGMGGRLFTRLRDQNSLAYTVAPMTSHGYHPGIFGCYIACAPAKTDQALQQLEEELDKICSDLVSEEELMRAKRYIIGSHESEYQQSDSQAMTMALMAMFGLGADDYLRYRDRLLAVNRQAIQKVAQRLFKKDELVKVIVGNA